MSKQKLHKSDSVITTTFLIVAALMLPVSGIAQVVDPINLGNVKHKTVRKYISTRNIDKLTDYSSLQPSWNDVIDYKEFKTGQRTFRFRDKVSSVWDNYRFSDPVQSWKGRFVRVSLLISKSSNSVYYPGFTSGNLMLDTGQVYFLNLKLIKGLFKLPVAFEIINIDPTARIIEYSYIKGNVERGKQTIQLIDEGENLTKVIHTSYYKSESSFRDMLYPIFHNKIIRNFHKKMRRLDNRQRREIISMMSNNK